MSIEPGSQLLQYRIVEKIGEGGMGVVWRAEDQTLRRSVALKTIRADWLEDEKARHRFLREARATAAINHPNIATIHQIDEAQDITFIAMEYVEGDSLQSLVRGRNLDLQRALDVAIQVADGLACAHDAGVIHRDLKPDNVMVGPDSHAKILDFGLAKLTESEGGGNCETETITVQLTQVGQVAGTPSYMSPEQASGRPVDARSDIFSFGVLLYEMVAGRVPFLGEDMIATLHAVAHEPHAPAASLNPDVPAGLDSILDRCLDKHPDRRFQDAHDLAAELRRLREGEPVRASSYGRATTTRRLLYALLTAAAMVLGYLALTAWERGKKIDVTGPAEGPSVAVLPFENIGGENENAAFAAGIHDDILNRVAKIGDLRVISRTSVMEYRSTTKSLSEIAQELGVSTVLEGGVQRSGNQVRINLQLLDVATEEQLWVESFNRELSAEQIFAIQSDVAGKVAAVLRATLKPDELRRIDHLPTRNLEAYDAYLKGLQYLHKPDYREEDLIPSQRYFREAVNLDPSFALAYTGLSRAARNHYWVAGGTRDALEIAHEAADEALRIDPDLPEAHLALGSCLYVERDYDAAMEHLIAAERGLPGNSELIRAKAFVLRRRGEWQEALQGLKRARMLDPRDLEAVAEVGFTLLVLRRYEEADSYYSEALNLMPDHRAAKVYASLLPFVRDGSEASARAAAEILEDTAKSPWTYIHGWQAMISIGEFDRASRFVSVPERVWGQWYSYPQSLLLGWTYWLEGREGARDQFTIAARLLEDEVAATPEDARLHTSLGVAYAGLGRSEEAVASALRGVQLMPIHKDVFVGCWLLQDLGWVYVMTGHPEAAVDAFDRILSVPSIFSIELLLADPRIDPLREHPGLLALVEKHRKS